MDRLRGVGIVLHCTGLRRDGLEYWVATIKVCRRKSLMLRNDTLVRRGIEVMIGHQVGSTVLPTASSAESQLGRCSSTLAVLLLAWMVLLLVRNQ